MAKHSEDPTPIPIPMEDTIIHTDVSPFCADPTYPCHEDQQLWQSLAQQVQDGLLTAKEATTLVTGKTL